MRSPELGACPPSVCCRYHLWVFYIGYQLPGIWRQSEAHHRSQIQIEGVTPVRVFRLHLLSSRSLKTSYGWSELWAAYLRATNVGKALTNPYLETISEWVHYARSVFSVSATSCRLVFLLLSCGCLSIRGKRPAHCMCLFPAWNVFQRIAVLEWDAAWVFLKSPHRGELFAIKKPNFSGWSFRSIRLWGGAVRKKLEIKRVKTLQRPRKERSWRLLRGCFYFWIAAGVWAEMYNSFSQIICGR